MKPIFFINCCQKQKVTNKLRDSDNQSQHNFRMCAGSTINVFEDYCEKDKDITPLKSTDIENDSLITTTIYFTFLSESVRGNRIIIRVYDENLCELPDIYYYQYEKTERPERIDIPIYIPKNSFRKFTFHYKVCNTSLSEIYFEGKFVVYGPKYRGHLTIGFACMSSHSPGCIYSFKSKPKKLASQLVAGADTTPTNQETSPFRHVWQRMSNWRDSFNFDLICHGGNNSLVSSLFQIYKKRGSVPEIFSCFRDQVCRFLADEAVSHVLRQNWNVFFFNELDLNIWSGVEPSTTHLQTRHTSASSSDQESSYNVSSEFMYYLRILYENYFLYTPRSHGANIHFRFAVGDLNIISLDSCSAWVLEGTHYSEKHFAHLRRSLVADKLNIVLLNRPLRYFATREPTSEQMLRQLMMSAASHKIKVISFHKNGHTYMQTHKLGETSIEECLCSGFNCDTPRNSLVQKYLLRSAIYWRKKKDKWSARRNRQHIITRGHRNLFATNGYAILVNNFLICSSLY